MSPTGQLLVRPLTSLHDGLMGYIEQPRKISRSGYDTHKSVMASENEPWRSIVAAGWRSRGQFTRPDAPGDAQLLTSHRV